VEYNWEKIFESKTNKELYDIVKGKTVLSKEARNIAKQELERRSFDFNNMEVNKTVWEISEINEEEDIANLEIFSWKAKFIPLRTYFLIITGIVIFYFLINKSAINPMPLNVFIFFLLLATFLVWFNNFRYKKQNQAHIKRIERLNKLKDKLKAKDLLKEDSPVYNELIRQKRKQFEELKVLKFITILLLVVFILVILQKTFLLF